MSHSIRYPGGNYELCVFNREDILDCIDKNITDKDVAISVIEKCEADVADYLRNGKWAGVPYFGSLRIPPQLALARTPEQQELIAEAQAVLDHPKYVIFRQQLAQENDRKIRQERFFKYTMSIAVGRNKPLYRQIVRMKGEAYARVYLYSTNDLEESEIDENDLDYDEQQATDRQSTDD